MRILYKIILSINIKFLKYFNNEIYHQFKWEKRIVRIAYGI